MLEMEFLAYSFLWHLAITAIFILCMISGIISYHSKEKSFGYYALYSFFLFIFLLFKTPYEFPFRDLMYESRFSSLNWYIQVIYNSIYFIFFIHFLDVKEHYPKFYRFIKQVVGIIFIISTALFICTLLLDAATVFFQFFQYIFVPVMFGFAIYTIVWALTIPGRLKFFITIGSSIYIILAVTSLVLTINYKAEMVFAPIFYFYVGITIEQMSFALGLAYKVRMINQKLFFQLRENERIKQDQNKLLEKELQRKEKELLKITTKAEEERISKLKSEFENEIYQLHLSALQSQMNPHFIFNALNSIKVFLIDNNKEQAVYYLNKFAKLIRKILDNSRFSSINLKEELGIIELYMGIENLRFDNEIGFSVNIDEGVDFEEIRVPPMILQPFVENALWHGLMLSKKAKRIEIHIYSVENVPMLSLRDNGIGMDKSREYESRKIFRKESLGLKMTRERMEYFNQREELNYSFGIIDLKDEDDKPCGTEIKFTFS